MNIPDKKFEVGTYILVKRNGMLCKIESAKFAWSDKKGGTGGYEWQYSLSGFNCYETVAEEEITSSINEMVEYARLRLESLRKRAEVSLENYRDALEELSKFRPDVFPKTSKGLR